MSQSSEDLQVEFLRRCEHARINAETTERSELEKRHGKVWDRDQLTEEFQVLGFGAPYVVVKRRVDGVKGSLEFQHGPPRLYWGWQPHEKK